MTDAEMQREIERAQRNTRKLRALQAENEQTTATVAALRGAPAPSVASTPSGAAPHLHPHPHYAVRG